VPPFLSGTFYSNKKIQKKKIMNISHFSVPVIVAIGVQGRTTTTVDLPAEYNRVVGVHLSIDEITNQDNFKIELGDGSKSLINETNHKLFLAGDGVAPNHKFMRTNFPYLSGKKFFITTNCVAAVSNSALQFEMTFLLTNADDESVARNNLDFNPGTTTHQTIY
jgi:hypothetical protein